MGKRALISIRKNRYIMEQFVYSNIFDTKGIEYLVVIAFLLLIIPFWIQLNKPVRAKMRLGDTLRALTPEVLRIPKGLHFSKNHTWSFLERSGLASVGMDDLLLHLTGGVELEYLKKQQARVKKGDPLVKISQGKKMLVIHSPLTGEIEDLHSTLSEDPGSLTEDPYRSWLVKIKPDNWTGETRECLLAEDARQWAERELDRFKEFMTSALSEEAGGGEAVLQTGGELLDHPLSKMSQGIWNAFQEKFLRA
jgi:glycine cleavage system H protein